MEIFHLILEVEDDHVTIESHVYLVGQSTYSWTTFLLIISH